jgi:autotransporter passenger strand-loop-strand repeat protein
MTTVNSGGEQIVDEGGTASGTTIDSGGLVVLEAGAVVSGGIAFAGSGTLEIVGSAMPSAAISGFAIGDIIDLASVATGSGGSAVLASGNVLDVVEGGSTYVLNLDPTQNFSGTQFVLFSDGMSRYPVPMPGRDKLSTKQLQGITDATAGVYRGTWWSGGGVAARGACAAVSNAGDWGPSRRNARNDARVVRGVSSRFVRKGRAKR